MNHQSVLELAEKWRSKAEPPQAEDASPEAEIENAVERGRRSALRSCAEQLEMLVKLLA